MRARRYLPLPVLLAGLFFLGCESAPTAVEEASETALMHEVFAANADQHLPSATRRELARARNATARYHDVRKAEAAGYVDIDAFVPGMGYHYINFGLLDCTFDVEQPEVLVITHGPGAKRKLVALEYAMPTGCGDAPEGFTGDADHWHVLPGEGGAPDLWTLHAWVWMPNPDGVFAPFNPRLLP